jgi:hypothetical protein
VYHRNFAIEKKSDFHQQTLGESKKKNKLQCLVENGHNDLVRIA